MRNGSPHALKDTEIAERPVDKTHPPGHALFLDGAEVAGVLRVRAVVPHHPYLALGHRIGVGYVYERARERIGREPVGVGLAERDAVHVHLAVDEVDGLAAYRDAALEEYPAGNLLVVERDDV